MQDSFTSRLSSRTAKLTSSAIRDILKVATQSHITSFAGGLPAPELFPVEALRAAAERVLVNDAKRALQYGATDGLAELREQIAADVSGAEAAACAAAGLAAPEPVDADQVLITTGSQQALDLVCKLLLDPGERITVENPSYLGALQAFRLYQPTFNTVDMDEHGALPDSLALALGEGVKFAYLLPSFQNPTGRSMSLARRQAVMQIVERSGTPLIEDDPYGALYFDRPCGPSLRSLAPAQTIAMGTFSKTMAPGLRLGWTISPKDVHARLVQIKQSADLHTSTLSQHVALEVIRSGVMPAHLDRLRSVYAERCEAMLAALAAEFPPEVRYTRPSGGMFVWLELPEGVDASRLLRSCVEQESVAFVPGGTFHANGGGRNTMRLNFTHTSPEKIADGVARLAKVVRRELTATAA